jgi:glycosyltransferase involved in cell wall biosynthesis
MRVKIIDAWSWGLPIVSTTNGAEGIKYKDGENILIADSAADLGHAVGRLIKDPQMAGGPAAAGRRTVETCYDWHEAYKAIDTIYSRGP